MKAKYRWGKEGWTADHLIIENIVWDFCDEGVIHMHFEERAWATLNSQFMWYGSIWGRRERESFLRRH